MNIFIKIIHKSNLIYKELLCRNKKITVGFLFITIIKSSLEGLMAISLLPLVQSVTNPDFNIKSSNLLINTLFEILQPLFNTNNIIILSFSLLIIVVISKTIITLFYNYSLYYLISDYEADKKNLLFEKYIDLNWISFLKMRSGDAINTLTREITLSRQLYTNILKLFETFITILAYTAAAAYISLASTISTFALLVILVLLFYPILISVKKIAVKLITANQNIMHHFGEFLNSLKIVKGSTMELISKSIIQEQTSTVKKYMRKAGFFKTLPATLSEPLIFIGIIGFIFFIKSNNLATFSESAIIGLILLRSYQRVSTIHGYLATISEFLPSFTLISELPAKLDKNKEIKNGKKINTFQNINFKNISFSYSKEKTALKDFNLTINKGEYIGVVGDSGSGKTTFIDLFLSLLEPTSGEIIINSNTINQIDTSYWRSQIGYVPQETILFNESISNNISLFRDNITNEDILWATKITDSHNFILKTEDQYETHVGDKGVKLSGGQKQRIAFARAIVNKPQILLLDEATSALDSVSERKIQKAIESLRSTMTIIVVAHRLSTIIKADKLIVLAKGKIVEHGEPTRLLKKKNGKFKHLYDIQMHNK